MQGQEDLQTHQVVIGIAANEDAEGHGVIDGDHLDQRLTPRCQCGFRLVSVHDDMGRRVLLLCRQ
jgi:hypothetical protein